MSFLLSPRNLQTPIYTSYLDQENNGQTVGEFFVLDSLVIRVQNKFDQMIN